MKKTAVLSILFSFIAIAASAILTSANAQARASHPKVYAVINKADWCPTCQANGDRVMAEVMPACRNLKVQFIPNDLTNEKTVASSSAELKKLKVYDAIKDSKATGLIILVDAKTKKIVGQISVAKPSEEIIRQITSAQS